MNVREMLEEIPRRYPTATLQTEFEKAPFDVFLVTLENGWKISVGYGPAHYSSTRIWGHPNPLDAGLVEIAIFDSLGDWFIAEGMGNFNSDGSAVLSWKTSDDLFQIIDYIARKSPVEAEREKSTASPRSEKECST